MSSDVSASIRAFKFPDGRTADVFVGGEPNGFPLVMHHGTPSDASTFADWHHACRERSLRLICVSRPGYALSTRVPGRTIAQVAADVAAILDSLGHARFVTAGWSGGGPHALACAAMLPDRCNAVATLAGVGPWGRNDLDFLAGMGPENVDEFGAALKGEQSLRAWLHGNAEPLRKVTGDELAGMLGGLVPDIDKQALNGGFAEHLAAAIRRALEPGFDGWIDDDLAFTRHWGFDVEQISVPVAVWQGELDLMVPRAHGRWLASHLPATRAHLVEGHGHISLVTRYREEILADLQTFCH